MEPIYELFLEAVRCALEDRQVNWTADVSPEQMSRILALAEQHHVLPLVFEAIYACPAATNMDGVLFMQCKRSTVQSVMVQAMKTEEFLALNRHLRENGVTPVVVKGIICRSLYPRPDYRLSGDEDVLCGEHQFRACHNLMIDFGMEATASTLDSYEVPYRKEDSALYIELHKTLFPTESDIFSACNHYFEDCFQRLIDVDIQGDPVATLNHTDHLLYLILHAFKHFLHAGFGIRQVCDMVLYANAFGHQIDWEYVRMKCRGHRADTFAAALFDIGKKHLGFDPEKACYPYSWQHPQVNGDAMLADLLYGGIYGSSDMSRVHSSTITLNAVSADKKGKKANASLLKTVFPSARNLECRFPYLRRAPVLLPVAWVSRIFGYAKESLSEPESSASDIIKTGSQRIELLRHYDIID